MSSNSQFLTRMQRSTLTADVCRKLANHVIRGDWVEGQRIPSERELCELLGIGRASLREALKALEIMGLIDVRVGDGTFVCSRSEFLSRPLLWALAGGSTDMGEFMEARRVVEKELASLAAERATDEDIAQIGKWLEAMQKAQDDHAAFLEADFSFHLAVANAARNRILLNAVQMMRNLIRRWMTETLEITGIPAQSTQEHRNILLAISRKNPADARNAMEVHLSHNLLGNRTEDTKKDAAARS